MSEVDPIPTEVLSWGGTQNDPGSSKKAAGYASAEKPRFDHFNWLWGAISAWVAWLASLITRRFSTLYSAIDTLDPGDEFLLVPTTPVSMAATVAVFSGSGSEASAVACDGAQYYAYDVSDGEIYAWATDFVSPVLWSAAPTGVGTPLSISTDGAIVALRYPYDATAQEIFIYDAASGTGYTPIHSVSGAAGQICAASEDDELRVYFTELQYIKLWAHDGVSASTTTLVTASGAVTLGLCVSDDYIHVVANDGGDVVYNIFPKTGGSGLTGGLTLKVGTGAQRVAMCCDGEHCYVAVYFSGAVAEFHQVGYWGAVTTGWSITPSGLGTGHPDVPSIEVDDRYVYALAANGYLLVINKTTGAMRFADENAARCVATDGVYIYTVRSGDPEVYRFGTGREASRWIVAGTSEPVDNVPDGTARRPFHKRALPMRSQ